MAKKVKYVYIKDCVSVCAKETRNWARGKYSHVSLNNGVGSEKRIVRRFCDCANVIECTYTNLDSTAHYTPRLLLLGNKPIQRITVLNIVGNCNTMVSILISYYNVIILWDHLHVCGLLLTVTSLYGA